MREKQFAIGPVRLSTLFCSFVSFVRLLLNILICVSVVCAQLEDGEAIHQACIWGSGLVVETTYQRLLSVTSFTTPVTVPLAMPGTLLAVAFIFLLFFCYLSFPFCLSH